MQGAKRSNTGGVARLFNEQDVVLIDRMSNIESVEKV
jgi:hypothetical protein